MMKWNLLIMLCFLLTSLCKGQQEHDIYYKQFRIEDGFASNEVYDVCEDANGYIWFATDQGIVRYNGLVFKTFTTKNGLEDNTILKFYEADGHIYFNYYKGGLGEIKNSVPQNHIYSDSIKKYKRDYHIKQLIKVKNRLFLTKKGAYDFIYQLDLENGDVHVQKTDRNTKGLLFGNQAIIIRASKKGSIPFSIRDNIIRGDFEISHILFHEQDTLLRALQKFYVANSDDVFDEGVKIERIKFIDGCWYLATENGIYILNNDLTIKEELLSGVYATSMHLDQEKNLWVTTHNQGVICIPKISVYSYVVKMTPRNAIEGLLFDVTPKIRTKSLGNNSCYSTRWF